MQKHVQNNYIIPPALWATGGFGLACQHPSLNSFIQCFLLCWRRGLALLLPARENPPETESKLWPGGVENLKKIGPREYGNRKKSCSGTLLAALECHVSSQEPFLTKISFQIEGTMFQVGAKLTPSCL